MHARSGSASVTVARPIFPVRIRLRARSLPCPCRSAVSQKSRPVGKIKNSLGDYPESVRRVARQQKPALVDLLALGAQFYEAPGPEKNRDGFSGRRESQQLR